MMLLPLAVFGCSGEEDLTLDCQDGKCDQVAGEECNVDELTGALPAGYIEGTLAFATCPKNENAILPYTCAIAIVSDDGLQRTGLLLKTGELPEQVEPQLTCLRGSRVAVKTTGVLGSEEIGELQRELPSASDNNLRWGGEIFKRAEAAACADTLEGDLPAGYVEGTLAFASCPKNAGATAPYTCAIVVDDGQKRTGLLLKTGELSPAEVEPQLACLLGARVAVQTTGVLESFESDELQGLVPTALDNELRWGGVIYRRVPGKQCAAPLEGDLPAGHLEGTLAFASCPKNAGATAPYTCAIVIVSDDGLERTGLLLKTGELSPEQVEPQLACLLGARVAVQTTGVLQSFESEELQGLVPTALDNELRWGGVIFLRP